MQKCPPWLYLIVVTGEWQVSVRWQVPWAVVSCLCFSVSPSASLFGSVSCCFWLLFEYHLIEGFSFFGRPLSFKQWRRLHFNPAVHWVSMWVHSILYKAFLSRTNQSQPYYWASGPLPNHISGGLKKDLFYNIFLMYFKLCGHCC